MSTTLLRKTVRIDYQHQDKTCFVIGKLIHVDDTKHRVQYVDGRLAEIFNSAIISIKEKND